MLVQVLLCLPCAVAFRALPVAFRALPAAATSSRRTHSLLQLRMVENDEADAVDNGDEADARPWWQRPPPVWPPRVDAPTLVLGDMATIYAASYLCLDVLTAGREADWQSEGAALASAWIVACAVTNAWDPTAVLPSLGLTNAIACVFRTAVDFASTRLVFALAAGVLLGQAVDAKLLALELTLGAACLALWRCAYTLTSTDPR